jgi:hypothetical protein
MRKPFLGCVLAGILSAGTSLACDNPESNLVHVRLLTPLASDSSKRDSAFTTVVTAPMVHCGEVLLPSGSLISGTIHRAKRVGLGVIRERAALELDFKTYESPNGTTYPLAAQLTAVDNAREDVTSSGQIKGILAASNTSRLVRGVWFRPSMEMLPHSLIGLSGASEKLWSGFGLGPQGAAALFAARLILFRFPEPEISLPIGTDLEIRVTNLPNDIPSYSAPQVSEVPPSLAEWIRDQPFDVTKSDQVPAEDVVNLAFIGSKDQLLQAFDNAGWDTTDSLTSRTLSRTYNAFAMRTGYATAPVFRLYYRGATPDLVFQKSLNTISKRHHIRIWSVGTFEDNEIWLGAATHDIAISLPKASHKIDLQIDTERNKVVEDLAFTDCAEPPGYVDRINAVRSPRTNTSVSTDGRIAVLMMRDCDPASDDPLPLKRPGRKLDKLARRMLLETRQYLMRDNIYYYGFQGARKMVRRSPRTAPEKPPVTLAEDLKPKKPSRSQTDTSFVWTSPVTSAFLSPTNTFSSDLIPKSGR